MVQWRDQVQIRIIWPVTIQVVVVLQADHIRMLTGHLKQFQLTIFVASVHKDSFDGYCLASLQIYAAIDDSEGTMCNDFV